jgi:hypothetical protein
VQIIGGTGLGEHGIITAYNGTTKVATMSDNWVVTPDNTSEYILVPADADVETWQHTTVTGDGDWAQLQTDATAILVDTGTTLETHLTDIKGATFSGATDSLEAVRDRGDAAWTTGAGGTPPQLLQSTTIATLASQVSFTLTAGSTDDDAYNGAVVVVTDAVTSTQKAVGSVSDYTGSTKTVTLSADPGIFTMAVGDTIDVIANASTAPTAAANAVAVWDAVQAAHVTAGSFGEMATEIASVLVDTTEIGAAGAGLTALATAANLATVDTVVDGIQTDLDNATDGLGAIKADTAAILIDTGTTLPATLTTIDTVVDGIQTDLSNATDGLGAIKTDTAAILVDTATTIPATIATIDTNVDAILVDTGTTLDAAIAVIDANVDQIETAVITNAAGVDIAADIAALNDIAASDLGSLTITELAALPSASPTLIQAIGLMYMSLRNKVDVTATTKEIHNDADTLLFTKTLSDDGTTYSETKMS